GRRLILSRSAVPVSKVAELQECSTQTRPRGSIWLSATGMPSRGPPWPMRPGAEYSTTPADPAQRRYEALRAYVVDGEAAEAAGARFGYSKATMYQMATDLRAGRSEFFVSSKPGPKGPRKTASLRERVLSMRAQD